jgi:fido (protein-threonine AMPylation protein)
MRLDYPFGATPLDPDKIAGLIPGHITTQAQLNEWEQSNILEAEEWAFSNKQTSALSTQFLLALHKKMFNKTWRWAGMFRKSNKNIGVEWTVIPVQFLKMAELGLHGARVSLNRQ